MLIRGAVAFLAATAVNGLNNVDAPRPSKKEFKDAQKQKAADAAAAQAKEDKMAAVGKAVELLKTLQQQILKEGEEEAATYNKFACFCKDTTSEKSEAIKKGEDEKAKLIASIESKSAERERLDGLIDRLIADIKKVEKEMKKLTKDRKETEASFDQTVADMEPALTGLRGAIKAVKNSKPDSFVQVAFHDEVRNAVMLADAMGFTSAQAAAKIFLQAPSNEVPMENYKFHSEGIISTLEKLLTEFQDEINKVNKAEVQSAHEYDMAMQDKKNVKAGHASSMEKTKKAKAEASARIASLNEQLSTVSATLLDDKEYLMTLSKMCSDKAKTWDQRSQARADELATLTQATEVVETEVAEATSAKTARLMQTGASLRMVRSMAQDEHYMNYLEAAAEAADAAAGAPSFIQQHSAPSFLQQRSVKAPADDKAQAMIAHLLKADGTRLKSTLLASLASKISSDPLAKVKGLIQELIEKLLQEAAQEANEKGFCDKATSDAEQKRDYAAEAIASLNAEMSTLEATTATLTEELEELAEQITELKDNRGKALDERAAEKKENEATIRQADSGLSALNMVIELLDKFYKTLKKSKVDLSLAQGPIDDAPDAGFEGGEAYTGAQAAAGGILGMLDVMKSDFERTISQTEKEEEDSAKDHMEFMTQSGISLAEKEEAVKLKTKQNDSAKARLEEAGETFEDKAKTLRDAVEELLELKPKCVDTGMSYEDRVARREDEIESLKKALCIFDRYEEYGPGGAADGC